VVKNAGRLHDVGKVVISDQILLKPSKLTKEEVKEVKDHSLVGAKFLESSRISKDILDAIKYHHERLDGTGYPHSLSGNAIPLVARILAVADVFDGMTSKRPYREAFTQSQAIEELLRGRGKQFDSQVVDALISALKEE